MWTEVSSSVPHLLHKALSIICIKWRCLLRVLCLIRSPVMSLDCVLFKYYNLVFVVELGPELSFRACLWILLGPFLIAKCWLSTQHSSFFFMFCIETPKDGSGPTNFCCLVPQHVQEPNTVPLCRLEISFSIFWHCCTNGDVLAAWRAFRAAWLSGQILTYFSGLTFFWISLTHSKMAYYPGPPCV
jgi:hypothetical protein